MAKKKRTPSTSGWSSLQWSKVDVNIGGLGNNNDGKEGNATDDALNEEDFVNANNHYDNPNNEFDFSDLDDKDSRMIEGSTNSINNPGIFLGLEVIDGSQYEIKKTKLNDGGMFTELVIPDHPKQKDISFHQVKEEKGGEENEKVTEENTIEVEKTTRKERRILRLKTKRLEAKMRKRKRKDNETQQQEQDSAVSENNTDSNDEHFINLKKKIKTKQNESQIIRCTKKENSLKVEDVQMSWSVAAGGIWLHPTLCEGLAAQSFSIPTPIQASTLPASILGQRDIVGAAPTGSGKTLAYALPILHTILSDEKDDIQNKHLLALVLCPTRELAMQVTNEFDAVCQKKVECAVIVGGLSEHKQKRVLNNKSPPVVVATPGRLWELMSNGEHPHLNDLSRLRFLVIDEADRMIKQGSFPQLSQIFEAINRANPPIEDDSEEEYDEEESDDEDRLKSLRGVKGEAKVTMLDDRILKMIELQSKGINLKERDVKDLTKVVDDSSTIPEPLEIDDTEYLQEQKRLEESSDFFEDDTNTELKEETEVVHRQTFIFSATLALPPSSHFQLKDKNFKPKYKGNKAKHSSNSVDGAIAEILEKAGATGQRKVVDLTSLDEEDDKKEKGKKQKEKKAPKNVATKLPPGLSLYQINCTQKHKDSHLYAFLTTTIIGSSGPSLVFCNSIAAVKRVHETLKILGLPVRTLHAQMQQKARMKAVESLTKDNSRSILIATDVAARGLDISSVTTVVHYDVARAIDTFIHRAGRTARGVGKTAVGSSISLVSASEDKHHQSICEAVFGDNQKKLQHMPIDGKLLTSAQERVALATKIVSCEQVESQTKMHNKWFTDAANDAGLELDNDLLEEGLIGGDKRERQQLLEARRAKGKLRQLLALPMRKQAFGKFLSGVGLQEAIKAEAEVKPFVVQGRNLKKKRRQAK
uniref:RNA helicase n=1 Tax=Eucampia antarctica TaxID=49252 RepID=A0A6U0TJF8_9STRA|mmetsp:Transcript_8486/g.8046  ORF Transcript_8486/g.8046 Transcript_8486/m.8046 type:complete len:927 (+) Transcript_8486:84-2864(+)|eukprot:CAMPEP_0197837984 /NCGR_PEP_ID=MMETSP1437-20131217/33954_1 /TAXON_ID=49252 ORGANISM="Eucampia antarctica, Strain CCMP1452" /NCGR_SAMPLE_ID=MMETSP1437 /ASSEMBLY_ACC=CAM_ASM_001096 /LENGTH=926 /DNA_ID=CAMNT_0043445479 /DNA_START=90 /DNA_END=2870 /DNA_ORIENTATION=-